MTAILLTGFDPFRQWPVNSSWEAVRHLAERRGGVVAQRLPVDHVRAAEAVRVMISDLQPEILLMTGLAPDPVARLERFGRAAPLSPHGGPPVRCGRWPWGAAQNAVASTGAPMRLFGDAGGYVCDTTYWAALGTNVPFVAFLHLPPPGPVWTPVRGARVAEAVLAAVMR